MNSTLADGKIGLVKDFFTRDVNRGVILHLFPGSSNTIDSTKAPGRSKYIHYIRT